MLCKHTGGAAPDLILSRWCVAWSGKTSWRKGPTPSQMKRSWPVFAGRGGGSSIGLESSEVLTLFSRDSEERLRGGTGGTQVGVWTSPSERRARERNASDMVRSPL